MFKEWVSIISVSSLVHVPITAFGAEPAQADGSVGANNNAARRTADDIDAAPWWRDMDRWSFQAGIGFINGETIDDIIVSGGELAKGDASGEIYLAQVSYKAAELKPVWFDHQVEFDLEVPFVLGVVDEDGRGPFMQYNLGLTFRWKTFPWNRWLYTNFETGTGLTYSDHVLEVERQRHPGRDRSHLEFYWPIQLTLAHPQHREHQLVLFLHHHSGGAIFHVGGANTLGFGYRFVPGERRRATLHE
jgi:hypothetical protein